MQKMLARSVWLKAAAFLFLALSAGASSAAAQKDSETWTVTASWVTALPEQEQTPVLILLNYALRQKVDKELIPNVKSGKDAAWAMKVDYVGHFLLSELATKSPEYKKIVDDRAGYLLNFIHGKSNVDVLQSKSVDTGKETQRVIQGLKEGALEEVNTKYAKRIEQTQTALIVEAMIGASPKK